MIHDPIINDMNISQDGRTVESTKNAGKNSTKNSILKQKKKSPIPLRRKDETITNGGGISIDGQEI